MQERFSSELDKLAANDSLHVFLGEQEIKNGFTTRGVTLAYLSAIRQIWGTNFQITVFCDNMSFGKKAKKVLYIHDRAAVRTYTEQL